MLLVLKALWFITVEAVRTLIAWCSVWLCRETLKTFLALVQHDVDIFNSGKKACIVGPQGDATCSRKHACECSSCGWMVRFDQWCLHCGSAETSSLGFLNYKPKQIWQLIWSLPLQNIQLTCYCHCLRFFVFWNSGLFTDVFVAMVFLAHWSFGLSFVAICVRGLSFGDFSFGKSQMP